VVNGQVSASKRDVIFKDFQDSKDPHVLIAHPGTMAHGLTLTTASTIIWYGPVNSNETYVQANGRIERIGKNKTSNLIHIESTALEHKMYDRLFGSDQVQEITGEKVVTSQAVEVAAPVAAPVAPRPAPVTVVEEPVAPAPEAASTPKRGFGAAKAVPAAPAVVVDTPAVAAAPAVVVAPAADTATMSLADEIASLIGGLDTDD